MAKKKKTAVRTGALAWKVNLSGTVSLFVLFLAMNIFLVLFDIKAGIIPTFDTNFFDSVFLTIKFHFAAEALSRDHLHPTVPQAH